ncbi:helix-turn-helix domain-containing protein [Planobispora siamensis]|uniref:Transcriptional regulator n=1 Tax=Planobispora siamensis TaxID=936338 RepID=A0A8J3SCE4_9ACTN|nr:helix-turn-helix transcriptional regulator [Planobispora siamensis]GIH89995.1 transcriptional regulator [Planobispora siamensis]
MAGSSPTLRRRQLAARLRELRLQTGMNIEDVANRLLCSTTKISRLETAQRGVSLRDVRDLCQIYGVAEQAKIDELMQMAREAKQLGLREESGIASAESQVRTYIDLETTAASIVEFQTSFLPGLMQTGDYARALMRGMLPRMTQDVLESRVESRLKRQELLLRNDAPQYWAVIDEAALHRKLGDNQIMRRQFERIAEVSELPNVTIQVIPFEAGSYMGLDNSFVLFRFPDQAIPDTVYIESLISNTYHEKASDTDPYREAIEHLRATALNPRESVALISRIRASYSG